MFYSFLIVTKRPLRIARKRPGTIAPKQNRLKRIHVESLETSFASYMAKASPKQKKAQHIARNNAALARAIITTWAATESAALFLLAHINSMYICEDTRAYKGDAADQKHYLMHIYVDDPLAKTELNAR